MSPLFRRIRRSRARLLAQEADRAGRWVQAIVADAHAQGAIVPDSVDVTVIILRAWADYLGRWAAELDR